ncbi:Oidioi.mRNA.OKI2018_I69.PAR.g11915.t1.cds [Oikopleura dioica]|uniref:Oidioi.mRNA.OKI2018_I69.PAR.g11915.t1.cds n=1 Tax=Oikopleura dioica TaxID=34765 RepID=A0ABN7RYC9_OIKDI|nr:Oidioi.mRNA.OKI2018_I69.PAR.g11915.t1.cds [Oikopleura dioica]
MHYFPCKYQSAFDAGIADRCKNSCDDETLISPIRDAFENASATIGDALKGIYFGTFDGYHYVYPCESTPTSCNAYDPRIRPWFLDAQEGRNKKVQFREDCKEKSFSGFEGTRIFEVLEDLHKCNFTEEIETCDGSAACLTCEDDDLRLGEDWSFKETLEEFNSLNATLWDLKFSKLTKKPSEENSTSVLGLQYNDAFRFGEINTVSRLMETGIIGLDIDILTRGPRLKNPLFKGIFDSKFKSEIFFLDSFGNFVYHPKTLTPQYEEKLKNKTEETDNCGSLSYDDMDFFYENWDSSDFAKDVEEMISEGSEDTKSNDDYEIFKVNSAASFLLMVVKYHEGEKAVLDEWAQLYESGADPLFNIEESECSLIMDQKVCFGEKNSPVLLMDAVEKIPGGEELRFSDGFNEFESRDEMLDAFDVGDEYINLNVNCGKATMKECWEDYKSCLTTQALVDIYRFDGLQEILRKSETCPGQYRVVAVTPSGLLYSYPHYEINADYPVLFESWYINAWQKEGWQEEPREKDGYDVISKAFFDEQELLFVLAVHLKHPNSTIQGWPQIDAYKAKYYEPVYLEKMTKEEKSVSYNCMEGKFLTLPKTCTFLDNNDCTKSNDLVKALNGVKIGCSEPLSWAPAFASVIVSVILVLLTMYILKLYHKKEDRARNELQKNPEANSEDSCCIIL